MIGEDGWKVLTAVFDPLTPAFLLAIELAAARIRMFSVEQIVARLDERFHLLTGGSRTALPRHQTLRAAIDWSYDLLSESEQTLFLRLSVFVGGWTLEAVEAVCVGEKIQVAETLELLTQLVHKSLAVAEEHEGEVRYRMLETIRRRHCTWSVKFAEEMEPRLRGQKPGPWLDKLEQGYENIRAAMSWLLAVRGHLNEVRKWLEKGLAKSEEVAVPVRAKALTSAGWQAYVQKDLVRAEELLHEGVALYKMLGDKQNTGTALYRLGLVTWARSPYTAANGLAEESLALFNEIEGKWGIANSLLLLSYISIDLKEYDRARSLAEEAVNPFRKIGDKWTIAYSLTDLADVVLLQGDAEATYMLVKESLALSIELDFRGMIAVSLEQLAAVATLREQPEVAARLWGAAEALREINAIPLYLQGVVLPNYQRMVAAVRNQLGNEALTSTWAEGRTMTPEQAIVMQERATKAVEMVTPVDKQLVPPSSPAPRSGNLAGLTTREIEVLCLVAMGLTDIQVAEKLVLSPRTISTHLRSIYSKLG